MINYDEMPKSAQKAYRTTNTVRKIMMFLCVPLIVVFAIVYIIKGENLLVGLELGFTFFRYSDIMLLPDGTCSVNLSQGEMATNTIDSDYGYYNLIATFYTYKGYKDLDSMFNECVAQKISSFEYENTVKE